MDTQTGYIIPSEEAEALRKSMRAELFEKRYKPMNVPPTPTQMLRDPPRIGRNETCPCGSGLKFKKCCLGKRSQS